MPEERTDFEHFVERLWRGATVHASFLADTGTGLAYITHPLPAELGITDRRPKDPGHQLRSALDELVKESIAAVGVDPDRDHWEGTAGFSLTPNGSIQVALRADITPPARTSSASSRYPIPASNGDKRWLAKTLVEMELGGYPTPDEDEIMGQFPIQVELDDLYLHTPTTGRRGALKEIRSRSLEGLDLRELLREHLDLDQAIINSMQIPQNDAAEFGAPKIESIRFSVEAPPEGLDPYLEAGDLSLRIDLDYTTCDSSITPRKIDQSPAGPDNPVILSRKELTNLAPLILAELNRLAAASIASEAQPASITRARPRL
ncbi:MULTISPECIES: hypothetical protein [unclassified Thioalkalivibrio]|uniref:hypothetical protein n=1 Tax=unclassified Thioalkalivibrio TaxID=2621013 RepID=UPI00037B4795|nr:MULTISPECIES: hypothetical protein [unclassified Thioalkalivibrio]